MPGHHSSLATLILAAGQSTRMGRPKLLLPWADTTVLGHLLQLWSHLPSMHLAVVCAVGDTALAAELDRLHFPRAQRITNPRPADGMFSSIRCAAQWPHWPDAVTHWAIALGDQPQLSPETITQITAFSAQNPAHICQPSRHGHGRHPVILPRDAFRALAQSNAPTLREFLQTHTAQIKLLELNDPTLDLDLDHPADYHAIKPTSTKTRA